MTDDTVTPAELRALAREYVTILQPGEVLVVRVPSSWGAKEVGALNDALDGYCSDPDWPNAPRIRFLVVPGDAISVVQPPPDPFS